MVGDDSDLAEGGRGLDCLSAGRGSDCAMAERETECVAARRDSECAWWGHRDRERQSRDMPVINEKAMAWVCG